MSLYHALKYGWFIPKHPVLCLTVDYISIISVKIHNYAIKEIAPATRAYSKRNIHLTFTLFYTFMNYKENMHKVTFLMGVDFVSLKRELYITCEKANTFFFFLTNFFISCIDIANLLNTFNLGFLGINLGLLLNGITHKRVITSSRVNTSTLTRGST